MNNLSTFFEFSPRIIKIIYTTNALEGFNRQVRKYTKARTIFPTDEFLNKCVYLATMEIMEKWTQPFPNWRATLAQLTLFFSEELHVSDKRIKYQIKLIKDTILLSTIILLRD